MAPRRLLLLILLVALGLASLACEHAEFSLPSGHAEGETSAPTPMDPAKVPASVVFFRARGGGASTFVPFACFDRTRRTILAGEACATMPLPKGAPINCVGGGSAPLGRATIVPCSESTSWRAYDVPGLSCDFATWGDAPPLPEVIAVPSIEPQVSNEERGSLEEALQSGPSVPLDLHQAISLDLNHDGVRDRVFTAFTGILVRDGKATTKKLGVIDSAPGLDFRVIAVTDLDHDLVPELWIETAQESLNMAMPAGLRVSLDRLRVDGTSTSYGTLACPAPQAAATTQTQSVDAGIDGG